MVVTNWKLRLWFSKLFYPLSRHHQRLKKSKEMRIRTIKPEFFEDEEVDLLSLEAQKTFIGLWLVSDKAGRLEYRPEYIRAKIWPYRPRINIYAILVELVDGKFLTSYEVLGRKYLALRTFSDHQRPHLHEPESDLPAPPKVETTDIGNHCTADDRHWRDGKEGKGRERKGKDIAPVAEAPAAVKPVEAKPPWSTEACDDWLERFGGTVPGGPIGKALKPLVVRYGWEQVRPRWRLYLTAVAANYVNPSRFASTYNRWRVSGGVYGAKPGEEQQYYARAVAAERLKHANMALKAPSVAQDARSQDGTYPTPNHDAIGVPVAVPGPSFQS